MDSVPVPPANEEVTEMARAQAKTDVTCRSRSPETNGWKRAIQSTRDAMAARRRRRCCARSSTTFLPPRELTGIGYTHARRRQRCVGRSGSDRRRRRGAARSGTTTLPPRGRTEHPITSWRTTKSAPRSRLACPKTRPFRRSHRRAGIQAVAEPGANGSSISMSLPDLQMWKTRSAAFFPHSSETSAS
jgi:hypothetical protein